MSGLLASPVQFFSDSLLGPVAVSTTVLYRILLIFNTFMIYIAMVAVFELLDRDALGRKGKRQKA